MLTTSSELNVYKLHSHSSLLQVVGSWVRACGQMADFLSPLLRMDKRHPRARMSAMKFPSHFQQPSGGGVSPQDDIQVQRRRAAPSISHSIIRDWARDVFVCHLPQATPCDQAANHTTDGRTDATERSPVLALFAVRRRGHRRTELRSARVNAGAAATICYRLTWFPGYCCRRGKQGRARSPFSP